MEFNLSFFISNILLGIGLAMDAFSASLANGLNEPCMNKSRTLIIAGVFGSFQAIMPLIGWACIHYILKIFKVFQPAIPYLALILLSYIGIKMIIEGKKDATTECRALTLSTLMIQGIATSIDALSVGFTISDYNAIMAFFASLIIGFVTFIICLFGLVIGKEFGTRLSGKAQILGGIILILIGLEIFIKGIF